jgi:LmbE family N-acetylglucosaminyl deacetylase
MLPLELPSRRPLRVIALGAHSDDIEIGSGATVLSLVRHADIELTWVVLAAAGPREAEARASFESFADGAASSSVECHGFRDGYFPHVGAEIKDVFEALKGTVEPDLIFTHSRHDRHQDHRVVSELTWNTWRDHLILEYEIPKYDGDLVSPNAYFAVEADVARRKVELLAQHFTTQRGKHWFDDELFLGLMRLRGAEGRSPSGYAEGFFAHKLVLGAVVS